MVLFGAADFLESNCTGKARDAIGAVLALKPDTAVLAATGAPEKWVQGRRHDFRRGES